MAGSAPAEGSHDLVVIGGGAAGFWVSIRAAEQGASVCLVSRKPLSESSSYWAQGGLAAALDPADSPASHAEDTLVAGRGLCRDSAVRLLVEGAPGAVEDLVARGIDFDRDGDGQLQLALEGGHSHRRIVHSGGSATGHRLTASLSRLVADNEAITALEETSATALATDGERCLGVQTDRGLIRGRATVLATGGAAALWSRTSNPWGAIGAGPVMASAAGADLADLEFCQFHPTCLLLPGSAQDGALISEALRGEGATLVDASGNRFTDELAPRDQVTEAILAVEADQPGIPVHLDLTGLDPVHFPSVFEMLAGAGLEPTEEPVPISPGAHYTMGGIEVDLDGQSTLPGLFAVGECACTGLHGANRLASNSLSECFVFGGRAAVAALELPAPDSKDQAVDEPPAFEPPTTETREAVWQLAGPIRDRQGLEALERDDYPLARAIGATALAREESRGGHRRSDYPDTDPDLDRTHLVYAPDGSITREVWD
ncbi:MAG: L-aspartate oxidase [Solirubrobacterales bacterium]